MNATERKADLAREVVIVKGRTFYEGCAECERQRRDLENGGSGFGPAHEIQPSCRNRAKVEHCTCGGCH